MDKSQDVTAHTSLELEAEARMRWNSQTGEFL